MSYRGGRESKLFGDAETILSSLRRTVKNNRKRSEYAVGLT